MPGCHDDFDLDLFNPDTNLSSFRCPDRRVISNCLRFEHLTWFLLLPLITHGHGIYQRTTTSSITEHKTWHHERLLCLPTVSSFTPKFAISWASNTPRPSRTHLGWRMW